MLQCPGEENGPTPIQLMPLSNGDVMVSWRHNNLIAVINRKTGKFDFEWFDFELGFQHDFQILREWYIIWFLLIRIQVLLVRGLSKVLEFDPKTKEGVSGSILEIPVIHFIAPLFQAHRGSKVVTH